MPWILFAFAIGCFTVAIYTHSMGLAVLCLLAALGLMLAGALSIVSARIQRSGADSGMQLNPALERHRIKQAAPAAASAAPPEQATLETPAEALTSAADDSKPAQ